MCSENSLEIRKDIISVGLYLDRLGSAYCQGRYHQLNVINQIFL